MEDIVIAVSGKLRHGKDTIGEYLVKKYDFQQIGFSDKLKSICMTYCNDSRDYHNKQIAIELFPDHDDSIIEEIDQLMWSVQPNGWTKLTQDECYDHKTEFSRGILQGLGHGMRQLRQYENVWVDHLLKTCQGGGRWVITDLRYKNEAFGIEMICGSQIWRVHRDIQCATDEQANHISETDLDDYPFEVVFTNNGTLQQLYDKVSQVTDKVLRGEKPFLAGEEVY